MFYIQGEGIGEVLYKNLIAYYDLKNVFINRALPSNYIYLSTSPLETLGYSIIESIADSKIACVYKGDDGVIYENFSEVKAIRWLTKDIFADSATLLEATQLSLTSTEMAESLNQIMTPSKSYSEKILENIKGKNKLLIEKLLL